VVLFSGCGTGDDVLWEWNGTHWNRLDVSVPPGRTNHSMVLDPVRRRIVLYGGGISGSDFVFSDTWEWDGEAWTELDISGPPGREMLGMIFDPQSKRIFVVGGRGPNRETLKDVWSFDGSAWRRH